MKAPSWLRVLLPILAIVGLILGPLAAKANGSAMATMSTAAMMGKMPSCPPVPPLVPDCQKACPPMVGCMAKSMPNTSVVLEPVLSLVTDAGRPVSDAFADPLGTKPLIPPPRA